MQEQTKKTWEEKDTACKEAWTELEKICMAGDSPGNVFSDWLNLICFSLLSCTDNFSRPGFTEKLKTNTFDGQYSEEYMKIVKRYTTKPEGKEHIQSFCHAWAIILKATQSLGKDILGEIYQQHITRGEHGQFFTPEHITEFMAEMIAGEEKKPETVSDPCCGSGRFLIGAGKKNPESMLYGTDIDYRCVRMTVLNMFAFDFNAVIYRGNSLLFEYSEIWTVRKGGFVSMSEVDAKETKIPKVNIPKTTEETVILPEGTLF